jgi:hypothetical protein
MGGKCYRLPIQPFRPVQPLLPVLAFQPPLVLLVLIPRELRE